MTSWYIEVDGVRTYYNLWIDAKLAWNESPKGIFCRANGTLIDRK